MANSVNLLELLLFCNVQHSLSVHELIFV